MEREVFIGEYEILETHKSSKVIRCLKFFASLVTTEEQSKRINAIIDKEGAWRRFPIIMTSLIVIQIAMFFGFATFPEMKFNFVCFKTIRQWPADKKTIPFFLIHDEFFHIIKTVLVQIILGIPLEIAFGSKLIGSLYIIGVVPLTVFLFALFQFGDCGGSAGVYTLVMFQAFNLKMKTGVMPYRRLQRYFISIYLAVHFLGVFLANLPRMHLFARHPFVFYYAHGALIALFYSWFFVTMKKDTEKWQRIRYVSMILYSLCFIVALRTYVNHGDWFPRLVNA